MLTRHEQEAQARVFLPEILAHASRKTPFTQGDPESAALLGLERALRTWDAGRKVSLRNWVYRCVQHALQHDRRDNSGVPRREWEAFSGHMEDMPEMFWRPVSLHGRLSADGDLYEELLPDTRALPGEEIEHVSWLTDTLARLTPRQALIIRECVMRGRAQEAVGAEIGISQMQVSRDKRKALAVLRRTL